MPADSFEAQRYEIGEALDDADAAPAEGGRPSLVYTTQLVRSQGHWFLGLWPEALEASGSFRSIGRPRPPAVYVRPGEGVDPERSRSEAGRRAAGRMRRYVVANRLNRFGTLTYVDAHRDLAEVHGDIGEFFRRIRSLVGKPVAYAWVTEWHPGGHGLHVHFALGRFIHWSAIKEAWGLGRIDIRRRKDLRLGAGAADEARQAARYLAKYVRKSFGDDRPLSLHRYDVAQGFQPEQLAFYGRNEQEVIIAASERMGRDPGYVWRSRDEREWCPRPDALWVRWDS